MQRNLFVLATSLALATSAWAEERVLAQIEREIASVAEQAGGSAVSIYARRVYQTGWLSRWQQRLWVGREIGWQRNVGSGVALDDSGHILTTAGVVAGAAEIQVRLPSGAGCPAWLVGVDEPSGVAVVRVQPGRIPAARFGDSDRLRPGQWAIVIGNALGVPGAFSLGVICGRRRPDGLIAMDARVSPGSSGAPVFDSAGRAIGLVVAAVAPPSEDGKGPDPPALWRVGGLSGSPAISLALPINRARAIASRLIEEGRWARGWVGLDVCKLLRSDSTATRFTDVWVLHVWRDSPAERAGLQPGDVLLEFNGVKVDQPGQLRDWVRRTPIGTKVGLKVRRTGRLMPIEIEVGQRPWE